MLCVALGCFPPGWKGISSPNDFPDRPPAFASAAFCLGSGTGSGSSARFVLHETIFAGPRSRAETAVRYHGHVVTHGGRK